VGAGFSNNFSGNIDGKDAAKPMEFNGNIGGKEWQFLSIEARSYAC